MKNLSILLFITILFSLFISTDSSLNADDFNSGDYIRVIYFHGTNRCKTCLLIESYIKESLDNFYAQELKEGKVKWESINFDLDENQHYMDKFNIYNQTLIIMKYKKGKEKNWKACEKVWQLTQKKDEFFKYVQNEVKAYLKD